MFQNNMIDLEDTIKNTLKLKLECISILEPYQASTFSE